MFMFICSLVALAPPHNTVQKSRNFIDVLPATARGGVVTHVLGDWSYDSWLRPTSLSSLENATSDRSESTQKLTVITVKMLALINRLLDWFRSLFWKEEMELTLVGLQYSGKTTFVNVIAVSLQLLATLLVLC